MDGVFHSIDAALPHCFDTMVVCRTSLVTLSSNMELWHSFNHLREFRRSLEFEVSLIYIVSQLGPHNGILVLRSQYGHLLMRASSQSTAIHLLTISLHVRLM